MNAWVRRSVFGALWLLVAGLTAQRHRVVHSDYSEPTAATQNRSSHGGRRVQRKISFRDVVNASSELERWHQFEQAMENPGGVDFKGWFEQAGAMLDFQMKKVVQNAILNEWIQVDPEDVWKHFRDGKIDSEMLIEHWKRVGNMEVLADQLDLIEGTYFAKWLSGRLMYTLDGVKDVDFVKRLEGHNPRAFLWAKSRAAGDRRDPEAVLALYRANPNKLHYLYGRLVTDPGKSGEFGMQWLDRIPESALSPFIYQMLSDWPAEKDVSPLVDWVFAHEDDYRRTSAISDVVIKVEQDTAARVVRRVLGGEGGLSREGQNKLLRRLSRRRGDLAKELLDDVDPYQRGMMLEIMGHGIMRYSNFDSALQWSNELQGFSREAFVRSLFAGASGRKSEYFKEWFDAQSREFLIRVEPFELIAAHADPLAALHMAGQLSPAEQADLFSHYVLVLHGTEVEKLREAFPHLATQYPGPEEAP